MEREAQCGAGSVVTGIVMGSLNQLKYSWFYNEKGGLGGSSTVEIDLTGDIHKDTDEEQQKQIL